MDDRPDTNAVLVVKGQPNSGGAVGFYSQVIVPLLCDFGLDRPSVAKYRRELLTHANGNILEIGFGTGLNLPHYPRQVHKITTVDPNVGMYRRAQRRIKQAGIEVDQQVLSSELLPYADNHFDCIVSTFTLCSIPKVNQALAEVYRVLKPGGKFLFFEHGLSPEPNVRKWQRRLNWLQMRLGDGCHLDRNMKELVAAQPFSSVEVREFYLEKTPKTHGYIYRGAAMK
jgi:ubiquinone/menaquinone biosynthesis C-methylase UbiE